MFKTPPAPPPRVDDETLDALADILQVLASPSRLALLQQLQTPRTVSDLAIPPSREDAGLQKDRALSRQSLERHLDILAQAGLVAWREGEGRGRPAKEYVLNHARLFAAVEELRALTRLRATAAAPESTMSLRGPDAAPPDPDSVTGPRVVLLRGVPEGRLVPLSASRETLLGRGTGAHVRLEHDPFVSSTHAVFRPVEGGMTLADAGASRNGTLLNGRRLGKGETAKLRRGNVIQAGRSLLLYLDE